MKKNGLRREIFRRIFSWGEREQAPHRFYSDARNLYVYMVVRSSHTVYAYSNCKFYTCVMIVTDGEIYLVRSVLTSCLMN